MCQTDHQKKIKIQQLKQNTNPKNNNNKVRKNTTRKKPKQLKTSPLMILFRFQTNITTINKPESTNRSTKNHIPKPNPKPR